MAEEIIEEYVENVPKFQTIGNLENAKRAFFNEEYDKFESDVLAKPYKFYTCYYKYSADYNGKPEFIGRNLNNGFNKQLEDYRKYLMCVFRCHKLINYMYQYTSLWIVNTPEDLSKIIGTIHDDFEWEELVTEESKKKFLNKFKKQEETDSELISECYLH